MDDVVGAESGSGDAGELLRVGEVGARLGVAPSTVRSWGRRYGLVPAGHSPGGHRRYTTTDLARLRRMQDLVDSGESPARAAAEVLSEDPRAPRVSLPAARASSGERLRGGAPSPGGPGGAVLAVPGATPRARGLARAASRLDARAVGGLLGDLLIAEGTVATWEEVLRPVLVAAGERWARTGGGIHVEHVLSEATVEALRAHRALQSEVRPGPPVLLACASEDTHVLPLHVVAAALAERHVPSQVLGARVPSDVVAAVAGRVGARGVLVWRQLRSGAAHELEALAAARSHPLVVAGGPGWEGCSLPHGTARPGSLRETVELFEAVDGPIR